MRALYIVVYFLFISGAVAQVAGFGKSTGVTTDAQLGISYVEVDVQGSPYINELYKKGTTVVYGKKSREALMRYNAHTNEIEIIDENGRARSILRQRNIVANFGGKSYEVVEYIENGELKLGYFNPLNDGRAQLLWRPKKIFVQAENPDNGYDTFSPPTFKDVSRYYIRKKGKPAETIRLSKRSILKYLDDETKTLKEYIRINNLNLKEEKDVITLVEFYNSLLLNKKPNESES